MSANLEIWLRWLTIISLSVGIIGALGAFGARILRRLDKLNELPEIKAEIEQLVEQSAQQHVENVRRFTMMEQQLVNSHDWHGEHLRREHGQPPPSGRRNPR